jgi:hypothetical protein
MDSSVGGALTTSNNSVINIPGVVFVDSNSSTALKANDTSSVTAGSIQVVGGVKKASGATLNPPPVTGVHAVSDPFASLPAYTGGTSKGSINIGDHTTKTIDPGIYTSIKVSSFATLILNPGVYVIKGGGLTISGNGTVKGTGVMIYNAGSNYPSGGGSFGSISLTNFAVLNISPATTGTYAGIAIFQSRDNNKTVSLGGNAIVNLQGGLLYAIKAPLALSTAVALRRAPAIVDKLSISGTSVIKNTDTGSPTAAAVTPASTTLQTSAITTQPTTLNVVTSSEPASNGSAAPTAPAGSTTTQASGKTLTTSGSPVVASSSLTLAGAAQEQPATTDGSLEDLGTLSNELDLVAGGVRPAARKTSGP